MSGAEPPRSAEALLRRLVGPGGDAASIVGDLHEEFGDVASRHGRRAASLWYWWQLVTIGIAYGRPESGFLERRRQDLALSLRRLKRNPGFAASVVVTLALSIGAGAAIFSVVDAVVLRPLPFEDPDALVRVMAWNEGAPEVTVDLLYADVPVFAEGMTSLSAASALSTAPRTLLDEEGEDALDVVVARTSENFFFLLGITPLLGRSYASDEVERGEAVVVISHGLWTRRFGADPAVIGRTVTLGSNRFQVIGVLPDAVSFPFEADVWRALGPREVEDDDREAVLLGRLGPGKDLLVANQEATAVAAALAADFPESHAGMGARVEPLGNTIVGDIRTALYALLGAVGLVLAIACVNTATLLLSRSASRSHEVALRSALGASRPRIIASHVTESLFLAFLGGGAGLFVGRWVLSVMLRVSPDLPRMETIGLDGRVIAVMGGVTALVGVLFAAGPALQAASTPPDHALRHGGRNATAAGRRLRIHSGLVATEVALSTMLAFLALLLFSTFQSVVAYDRGFDPRGLVSVTVDPMHPPETGAEQREYFAQVTDRIARLGTVSSVGLASHGVLERRGFRVPVGVEGRRPPVPTPQAWINIVSTDFFSTAGITLVAGQLFSPDGGVDGDAELVVNERFFDAHLAGADAGMGSRIDLEWVRGHVVGVVKDVSPSFSEPALAKVYVSIERFTFPGMAVIVRTIGPPASALPAIEHEILALPGDVFLEDVTIIDDALSASVAPQRFNMMLVVAFATLALSLAAVGIYGVTAYSVATRRSEIGIRRALGASDGRVGGEVAWRIALLTGSGVALGVAGALAGARFLSTLLYGVTPTEPRIVFLVALTLSVTAAAAGLVPVLRAIRVDPTESLHGG